MNSGANLRDALREWAALGGQIREIAGTGELLLWSDLVPNRRAKINRRRKDCQRAVTVLIRRLREALGGAAKR